MSVPGRGIRPLRSAIWGSASRPAPGRCCCRPPDRPRCWLPALLIPHTPQLPTCTLSEPSRGPPSRCSRTRSPERQMCSSSSRSPGADGSPSTLSVVISTPRRFCCSMSARNAALARSSCSQTRYVAWTEVNEASARCRSSSTAASLIGLSGLPAHERTTVHSADATLPQRSSSGQGSILMAIVAAASGTALSWSPCQRLSRRLGRLDEVAVVVHGRPAICVRWMVVATCSPSRSAAMAAGSRPAR